MVMIISIVMMMMMILMATMLTVFYYLRDISITSLTIYHDILPSKVLLVGTLVMMILWQKIMTMTMMTVMRRNVDAY